MRRRLQTQVETRRSRYTRAGPDGSRWVHRRNHLLRTQFRPAINGCFHISKTHVASSCHDICSQSRSCGYGGPNDHCSATINQRQPHTHAHERQKNVHYESIDPSLAHHQHAIVHKNMAARPMNAAAKPTWRPAAPSPGVVVGALPPLVRVPVLLAEPDGPPVVPPPTVGGL